MDPAPSAPIEHRNVILVVDDDREILKIVADILTRRNYSVLTANSGPEALKVSRGSKETIDLLLSDFQMPEMSGIELATTITRERPAVKVLLMSGFPDGMLVLNEGWHFLSKPFISSQLCALVSGLIATK